MAPLVILLCGGALVVAKRQTPRVCFSSCSQKGGLVDSGTNSRRSITATHSPTRSLTRSHSFTPHHTPVAAEAEGSPTRGGDGLL